MKSYSLMWGMKNTPCNKDPYETSSFFGMSCQGFLSVSHVAPELLTWADVLFSSLRPGYQGLCLRGVCQSAGGGKASARGFLGRNKNRWRSFVFFLRGFWMVQNGKFLFFVTPSWLFSGRFCAQNIGKWLKRTKPPKKMLFGVPGSFKLVICDLRCGLKDVSIFTLIYLVQGEMVKFRSVFSQQNLCLTMYNILSKRKLSTIYI